jgi:outer membrane protein OmpA-like peptidoglycan-associated protein
MLPKEDCFQVRRNCLSEKFGIDKTRLSATGYGDTKPVGDNRTSEGWKQNRRIEADFDALVIKKYSITNA